VKTIDWSELSRSERTTALARPAQRRDESVVGVVKRIFDDVESRGDAAVAEWATKLDGSPPQRLALTASVVDAARAAVEPADLQALELARANVQVFHDATRPVDGDWTVTTPGVKSRRVWRPISTAGLYVPGGTAPLFSTLLMLAIPAAVAGVPTVAAVTPPSKDGGVHPMVIAAAAACRVEAIHLVGGAQAIAALTFGACGLPKADKLFGPGNAYVAEAKRYAAELPGGPGVDMPAGPSELLVIADETADPALVAADLLSQAEHDSDAQVILVSPSDALIAAVLREVESQVADLPRAAIARRALEAARAVKVRSLDEAVEASNLYAPEHLSLQVADAETLAAGIVSAGTVFVGAYAAETFGDYVSGPSHVLPTDGAARTYSGVTVQSFMTSFAVQQVTREGAARLAGPAARLARLEGLEAHARAADRRGAA
jgi:histidinol dehydrogenase